MATLRIENMRHGYHDVIQHVLKYGHETAPRGQRTLEVLDAVIILHDLHDALPVGVGRSINPRIAAAEAIQLIGQFTSPEMMVSISPVFERFLDNGEFWGAYGGRVGAQVACCVDKLRADPDTRQALVVLWNPSLDNEPGKHDYPCTTMLQFLIRNDELIMHTTMRSNDVYWGLAYDVFQFTQLQLTVARCLGIPAGCYHHHAVSLHAYERDLDALEAVHPPRSCLEYHPVGFGYEGCADWWAVVDRARGVGGFWPVDPGNPPLTESERWYDRQLESVR